MKKNNKNKDLCITRWIDNPVRRLMSLGDACRYLRCSLDLIEDMISMGEIPIIRFGQPSGKSERRKRWIDIRDLDNLIESKKEIVGDPRI